MKFTKNLISIIVPVFNRENTLEKSILSLINQTYENLEIICIDDGSSDGSLVLLKKFAAEDQRIKIYSQTNKGPAAARNVGLAKATGEFLMFCDSDDEYLPNMCEEMIKTIKQANVDLVMCNANVRAGDVPGDSVSNFRLNVQKKYCNSITQNITIQLDLTKKVYLNVLLWNKIFKREIIENNKISFPEGCEHDDDFFVFIYSLFIDKYFALNKILYKYYINSNSIMDSYVRGKPKNKYDLYKICYLAHDFINKTKHSQEHKTALKEFIIFRIGACLKTEWFSQEELINLCKEINERFKELNLFCFLYNDKLKINDIKNFKKNLPKKIILAIFKTLIMPTKKRIKKLKYLYTLFKIMRSQ